MVIDAPCGEGKTTWAIEKINKTPDENFVYCTQLLTEIDRIVDSCKDENGFGRFIAPNHLHGTTKIDDFNRLLALNNNIAVTHKTFLNANSTTLDCIREGNYTLIIDEALDTIIDFNSAQNVEDDIRQTMLPEDITRAKENKLISIDMNGKVTWTGIDSGGGRTDKLAEVERYAKLGRLYCVRDTLLLVVFPPEIFDCFDKVYVLTYMFGGSIMKHYFNYHDIRYSMASVKKYGEEHILTEYSANYDYDFRQKCRKLINICDRRVLNRDYQRGGLTKTWWEEATNEDCNILKGHVSYYLTKINRGTSSKDIMWTCIKEYQEKIEDKGYKYERDLTPEEHKLSVKEKDELRKELSCFVPCNARATNRYGNKSVLVYCCNMHLNPYHRGFFEDANRYRKANGKEPIKVDGNMFALSCMIQWIFRSRIRNNESINIYIPSGRMRNLLTDWLGIDRIL